MATTRIKDVSKTTTDLASDEYIVADGATNGTQKMARDDAYADWAAAYVAAPTTYKLAPLNSGTNKIDGTYLPTSADTAKGEWNANTNTPSLADGAGTAGDYYDVTTAGSVDLGSGSITYTVGDVVKYNGTTWYKIDSVANVLDGSATAAAGRTTLEVNSVAEDAEATGTKLVSPSLYFDGVNDFLEIADSDKLSFTDGTDDLPFSIGAWVKPNTLSLGVLVMKGSSGSTREYQFRMNADGRIRVTLRDNSLAINIYADTDNPVFSAGEFCHVAFTFNPVSALSSRADDISIFKNGVSVASTATNNASYLGMENTGDSLRIGGQTGAYFDGHIKEVKLYNRSLSAAEVVDSMNGDLGFADEWGEGHGDTYTSDFSAGADSNSANAGTVAGNIDSIGGEDDNLRFTIDTAVNQHFIFRTVSGISVGKRYKISFDYYIDSTNTNIDGLRFRDGSTADLIDYTSPTLDTWNRGELSYIAVGTQIRFYALDGGSVSFQDATGTDVFYIRNVTVTEIGTLADLRASNFDESTDKLYDESSNAFIAVNSGSTLVGRALPVYETGTWTPGISFGGGTTGITYSAQEGYYTREGNQVTVHGSLTLSAVGSDTGQARLVGFPFTARNTTASMSTIVINRAANMAALTSAPNGQVTNNATTASLYDWGATGQADVVDSNFTATTSLAFSGTYQIQ